MKTIVEIHTSESQICLRHKTYRENAHKCDSPKFCKIAEVIKPNEHKKRAPVILTVRGREDGARNPLIKAVECGPRDSTTIQKQSKSTL